MKYAIKRGVFVGLGVILQLILMVTINLFLMEKLAIVNIIHAFIRLILFLGLIKNDYEDGSYYDPLVKYPQTFYYDTIDNCTKYYEISYNPKLNKALCIDGNISRINPFSATIIRTN